MGRKNDPFYHLSRRSKFWDFASAATGIDRPSEVREMDQMWQEVQSKLARDQVIGEFRMSETLLDGDLELLQKRRETMTDEERDSYMQKTLHLQKLYLTDKLGPDGWAMYLAWKEEQEEDEL